MGHAQRVDQAFGHADPVQDALGVGEADALEGVGAQPLERVGVVERVGGIELELRVVAGVAAHAAHGASPGSATKFSMSNLDAVSRNASSSRSAMRRNASA